MLRSRSCFWLAVIMGSLACGRGAVAPTHLRLADAASSASKVDWTKPVVLELQPGDRLPVRFSFSSQLFALSPAAPQLELVAKRRCFVRVSPEGLTTSLTRDDFDVKPQAPGQFRLGLSITPAGTHVEVAIVTPRLAEPASSPPPSQPAP